MDILWKLYFTSNGLTILFACYGFMTTGMPKHQRVAIAGAVVFGAAMVLFAAWLIWGGV